MDTFLLEGTIVAPLTPMAANGDIDYNAIEPYVAYLSEIGVDGIFVNGSLGEGMSLTVAERQNAAEHWISASKGRIKHVIVHVGAVNLHDTVTLARHAESAGADAIASVCSVFFKPQSLEQLVAYIEKVAAAAPSLPYFYYDIDFLTGVHLDALKFLDLAKDRIPNLRGLKYTTRKLNVAYLCSKFDGGRFQVAIGTDDQCLPYLSVGLGVTITDTTYASLQIQLKKAYNDQDYETARKFQDKTATFTNIISKYGTMVPVAKAITTKLSGVNMPGCRLPMTPLTPTQCDQLMEELGQVGYFEWIQKVTK